MNHLSSKERYLVLKDKSLVGQVLKAQRTLERQIRRKLFSGNNLDRFRLEVAKAETRLNTFRREMEESKTDNQTLVRKQPGYQTWGEFQ